MAALTFLNAVTSTGAGSKKDLTFLVKNHTVQVTTTGSPTAVTMVLKGSIDGVTFFDLVTHAFDAGEITANGALFHLIDVPVTFVNLDLTVLTGGTTPTVTAKYEGDNIIPKKISRRMPF